MAALRLRDRDAIITKEGLIFRVFGYCHPPKAYICDVEYAPAEVFKSRNPKALRSRGQRVFYKFYEDQGWKFVKSNFPHHMIFHEMLQNNVVGVKHHDVVNVRRPNEKLKKLVEKEPKDELLMAMHSVLQITTDSSGLSMKDFGVFGSLLHGFYHPKFSDIDLVIYGRENLAKLRKSLKEMYQNSYSPLRNEFQSYEVIKGKRWRFQNYSSKEFAWHQERKMIYALFNDKNSGRLIKTEFEPVKKWEEIREEQFTGTKIMQKGWVKIFARIIKDQDAAFIPAVYEIKPLTVLHGTKDSHETTRIISYLEEFRMQAQVDEKVYVEGNLEEVETAGGSFHQVTLTYCPRYYQQALKVAA